MTELESKVKKTLDDIFQDTDETDGVDGGFSMVSDRGSDTLVVALGDSWTWGDSLSDRANEVYGRIVSDHYDADFVNFGFSGFSNSWILMCGIRLIETLRSIDRYKKIYVLTTLTENGRDIESAASFDLAGWAYTVDLKFTNDMYQHILDHIEEYWTNQIKEMISLGDGRFSFFIGQNFVWHSMYEKLADLSPQVAISDVNWIEVIGDHLEMERPIRTNLVSGWVFDQVNLINNTQNISVTDKTVYQKYITPFIEKAILVNQWLDASPMNSKKASKHPNAEAHRLWANHIVQRLSTLKV